MPEETLRQQAEALLELHEGACSVPHSSPLHREFYLMHCEGQVDLVSGTTSNFVNVYIKNYKPRFEQNDKA